MAIVINMPRLSDTMTEGVVAKWHVKVGDNITEGSLLAEIETDKATMDFEAFPGQEGILLFRGMDEGASAPVDTILAILGDKDEDISALISDETKPADTSESIEADKESVLNSVIQTQVPTQVIEPVEINLADERIKASPLAKSLAKEKGIDISKITGTGEGGRIIKRDIETHQVMPSVSPVAKKSYPSSGYSDVPISQMRKTIAKRLAESKFTAPHFYLTISVDMDAAIDARKILNLDGDVKISFNDLVVKAVSKALKKHPEVNSSWLGEVIRTNYDINVGVAVAVEDGLLVPVIRNAELMQITRYKKSGFYGFHKDGRGDHLSVYNQSDNKFLHGQVRKLSMTVLLNDNYEGGEFQFASYTQEKCTIDTPEFNKTGMIIVFPSDMEHRVAPVTKGIRYSLVVWFVGPPFK